MNKPAVSQAGSFLATWSGVGFDDVVDVAVILSGQVQKLKPVGRGYQMEVVLGDVAHEQKLTCKELAVHLIGLNSQESTETANGFGVEPFSCVGPCEGMGEELVPGFDKGDDVFTELFNRKEVGVFEAFAFEDAKPYLNHVQPGGVEGNEVDDNSFVLRLQPFSAFRAGSQGRIWYSAELGHGLAEIVVEVGAEIVHDVVKMRIRRMHSDVGGENATEGMSVMIVRTLAIDLTGCRIQKGEQIGGAVTYIVEVLQYRQIGGCGQVRREAFERLDASAFIEAVQVLGWIQIAVNNVVHLGEEIRIGDLQVVFAPVRLQRMLQKDSLYGRTTDRAADKLRMFFEIALCIAQGPRVDSG